MDSTTIEARLAAFRSPAGFDYLRLFLAISVLSLHSVGTSYGREIENHLLWQWPLYRGPLRLILVAFFALSGFLVAGSIFRSGSTTGLSPVRMTRT